MLIHVKLWRVEVFGAKSPGPRSNVLRKSMGIKTVLFGTTLLLFSKPPSFFPWKGRTLSRVKSSTINIFFSLVGTHLHRNSKFTNSLKSLSCRSLYFCFTGDIVAFRWCNYVNWCWNRQMSFSLESVLTGNFFFVRFKFRMFFLLLLLMTNLSQAEHPICARRLYDAVPYHKQKRYVQY